MAAFKVVPRSAVYGQVVDPAAQSMPAARADHLRAGPPGTAAQPAHLVLQRMQSENAALRAALQKVVNDRKRIVAEANAKLGSLAGRVRQLEGFIKTGYTSQPQAPGQPPVGVGVPTHAMENPYVYGTDGGRHVVNTVPVNAQAGNPRDAAGPPNDAVHTVHETVRAAEDAIFYGRGDSAFYEGGEND